ncbi:hypothetical protein B296_00039637 [Ensete ventricosum]|uniref:Uncharacterized protein n=1 Tax=Ensete ventricosum TaxID=4639 RepID=A0A426Z4S9_ENSVE|nr:hypothetical protein B296_00039637 [Ensete ventricosum]
MVAGAGLSSSSFHLLHLRPSSTFRSLNLLVFRKPPLILSSSSRAAARAHSLAGNFEWHGSAPRSKRGSDGFWEDPDDGYDSELEEVNQEVEDEEGEEVSGDEGDARISTVSQYDDLVKGQIPFMDRLLEDGSTEIDCLDKDGATPLHYAAQVGAMQTVKLLIKYKVDVNVADNDGWTPLHVAIQTRSRDIAKVLLVNGADKMRKNKDGKTPLDLSLCFGKDFKSYELAKLLKLVPANRNF